MKIVVNLTILEYSFVNMHKVSLGDPSSNGTYLRLIDMPPQSSSPNQGPSKSVPEFRLNYTKFLFSTDA